MIQTEMKGNRIRHYSNANMKIRQIESGRLFTDAVDVVPCPYSYEETGVPIEEEITEESALTRYANELTGASDTTLTEATETLIKHFKED